MKFMQTTQNENFMLDDGEKGVSSMFTSLDEMDNFDMAIRKVLKSQQEKLGLTDDAVGKIAFGFMGGHRTKVQAIFVGQGANKYRKLQRLRLTDVMNLSNALGLTLKETLKRAQDSMKQKSPTEAGQGG